MTWKKRLSITIYTLIGVSIGLGIGFVVFSQWESIAIALEDWTFGVNLLSILISFLAIFITAMNRIQMNKIRRINRLM